MKHTNCTNLWVNSCKIRSPKSISEMRMVISVTVTTDIKKDLYLKMVGMRGNTEGEGRGIP